MSSKKFYNDVEIKADIILDNETAERALTVDANGKVSSSAVTSTELGHLSGATSNIQTQISDVVADLAQEVTDRTNADAALQGEIDALEAEVAALPDPVVYKGTYDASTNTPTLANTDTDKNGFLYYVSVAGTVDFGAGPISFEVGDKVVNNGTTYDKWDMTDAVASVFGRTGVVVAEAGDYNASQVTNTPTGTIAATDVQSAINELDSDVQTVSTNLANHISNATGAHAATAISFNGTTSGLSATEVQAAIDELAARPTGSPGDIEQASFSLANNQAVPADVTGFLFNPASVRSFEALVSVEIDASSDLYEVFKIYGIQRGTDFQISVEGTGDESGVAFSITTAGQIQYTSTDVVGFATGVMKFRATVTNV